MAEDNIGGRPVDITKDGNQVKIVFHPIAKNATQPKANVFTVKLAKADIDKIKSLNPAFIENGTVTAATSSPFSIGAAALLITSDSFAEKRGLKTRAEIVSRAVAGVDWQLFGMGPIPAAEKALNKAGITMNDIETIELNEAFAAQSLYCINEDNWDIEKINLNGGAIALGHPLGCTGAKLTVTILSEMERRGTRYGIVAMCVGGGMGAAGIFESYRA